MKQLKFECPECGTEFTLTANQTKAKERIEALKKAGVDVSELFAMQSADGLEFIDVYKRQLLIHQGNIGNNLTEDLLNWTIPMHL